MVLVLTTAADPLFLSNIALPSLLVCWILALLMPFFAGKGFRRELRWTGFVLAWAAIAVVFPLIWDLPWAILHDWVNGATADDRAKWYFWAYAVADTRFLHSDRLMLIVEYWSGAIGILEIGFLSYFVRNRLSSAVRVFIMGGSLQFYGCSIFFGSELMNGFASIRSDLVSLIKFFGLNGMWVVLPAVSGLVLLKLVSTPDYDASAATRRLFGSRPTLRPPSGAAQAEMLALDAKAT